MIARQLEDPDATARWLAKLKWLAGRDEDEIASASQRNTRAYVPRVLAETQLSPADP